MQYWLAPAAEKELVSAANYYAKKASPQVAKSFVAEFKRITAIVAHNQKLGTLAEAGLQFYPFRRFPYSIVYEESPTGPLIYAVASQYRNPNYWLDRL